MMANGMLAGFKGNEVHIMEPYLPYACNPNYIKPFPNKVVGICPFEGGLYVTTTAEPYILMGTAPENMTDSKVPAVQAGVSKGSIVAIGNQVIYASNDGLVMAQGLNASLDMSFKFFTRDVWRDRYGSKLSNMRLSRHDGNLVVWFDDGTPGFIMRFEEENPSFTKISDPIYAAFVSPLADALYVASGGSSVYVFGAGASRQMFRWWSREYVLPKPTNFGAMQLKGSGTLTVYVYADGALKHMQAVTLSLSGTLIRLPSGFLAKQWSVRLVGDAGCELHECPLVTTPTELQNV